MTITLTFDNQIEYDQWLEREVQKVEEKNKTPRLTSDISNLNLPVRLSNALERGGVIKIEHLKNLQNRVKTTLLDRYGNETTYTCLDDLKRLRNVSTKSIEAIKKRLLAIPT